MDGVARRALGDVLGGDDAQFDIAGGDRRGQALGGGLSRVKPDEFATRGGERRRDAMEAPDAHEVGRSPAVPGGRDLCSSWPGARVAARGPVGLRSVFAAWRGGRCGPLR